MVKAKGPEALRVLRELAMPDRSAELVRGLEARIRAADQELLKLDREWDLLPKEALAELWRKLAEISRWQVRRRTLIEVWELATNLVWATSNRK